MIVLHVCVYVFRVAGIVGAKPTRPAVAATQRATAARFVNTRIGRPTTPFAAHAPTSDRSVCPRVLS